MYLYPYTCILKQPFIVNAYVFRNNISAFHKSAGYLMLLTGYLKLLGMVDPELIPESELNP